MNYIWAMNVRHLSYLISMLGDTNLMYIEFY